MSRKEDLEYYKKLLAKKSLEAQKAKTDKSKSALFPTVKAEAYSKPSVAKTTNETKTKLPTVTKKPTTGAEQFEYLKKYGTTYKPEKKITTHKSVANLTPEAKAIRDEEVAKSKIMQTAGGIAYGFMPFAPSVDEDKRTTAFNIGNIGGTILSYALGYGAAKSGLKLGGKVVGGELIGGKAISTTSAANKLLKLTPFKKTVGSLSKSKVIQNFAKKELARTGTVATEAAVKELAENTAEKAMRSALREGITDFTAGAVLDMGQAQKAGIDFLSDEWKNDMVKNALFNVAVGGAFEVLPYAAKGIKRAVTDPKQAAKALDTVKQVEVKGAVKDTSPIKTDFFKDVSSEQGRKEALTEIKQAIKDKNFDKADYLLESLKQGEPTTVAKELPSYVKADLPVKSVDDVVTKAELPKIEDDVAKAISDDLSGAKVVDDVIVDSTIKSGSTEELDAISDIIKSDVPVPKAELPTKKEFKIAKKQLQAKQDIPTYSYDDVVHETLDDLDNIEKGKIVRKGSAIDKQLEANLYEALELQGNSSKSVSRVFDNLRSLEAKNLIISETELGTYAKQIGTTADKLQVAVDEINSKGIRSTLNELQALGDSGRTGDMDIFKASIILDKIKASDNEELISSVSAIYIKLASNSGYAQLANKILSASPSVRIKVMAKDIKSFMKKHPNVDFKKNEILNKKISELNTIKSNKFTNLDGAERTNAIEDAEKRVAQLRDEIVRETFKIDPPSLGEMLERFMVTNMLASGATQARNVIGNAMFGAVRGLSKITEAALERIAKVPIDQRTNAIILPFGKDSDLLKVASDRFKDVNNIMGDEMKYMSSRRALDIPFFSQRLGKVGSVLDKRSWAWLQSLEAEDRFFIKKYFDNYWSQYVKAKGYTADNIPEEIAKLADEYAYNEALVSTFRNANEAARKLTTTTNRLLRSEKGLNKILGATLKINVPFVRVPANVLRAGVQYNPLYLLKGTSDVLKVAGKGDVQATKKAIEELSKGLTGTGVAMLGAYLSSQGVIRIGIDDTKETEFEELQGNQEFSFNIGDHSFSAGWAVPIAIPLLEGAMLYEQFEKKAADKDLSPEETSSLFYETINNIPDLLTEMTMLQGVTRMLEQSYGDENLLVKMGENTINNGLNQLIPRELTQAGQLMTNERLSTLSTSEDSFDKKIESLISQLGIRSGITPLKQAITGEKAPIMYDEWGRPLEADSPLEVLLSPSRAQELKTTPVDKELDKLYGQLTEDKNSILPSKSYTYDIEFDTNSDNKRSSDETIRMTEEEYALFSKTKGQNSYKYLNELFNSKGFSSLPYEEQKEIVQDWINTDDYKSMTQAERDKYFAEEINTGGYDSMTAEEKKKAIKSAYDQAREDAKTAVLKSRGISDAAIKFNNISSTKADKDRYINSSIGKKYGINFYVQTQEAPIKGANNHILKDSLIEYLDGLNLPREDKRQLFDVFRPDVINPY